MPDNFTPAPFYKQNTNKTRPVRKAAPAIKRFSGQVFQRLAQQTRFMEPALARQWGELVGKDIAKICRPGRLLPTGPRTKTLELIAMDGSAATRLNYERATILSSVSRVLGSGTVTELKILQTAWQSGSVHNLHSHKNSSSGDKSVNREENPSEPPSPLEEVLAKYKASLQNKNE